jgi:hypothetical protein
VLRYTDHYARSGGRPSKKESLVVIYDNVLIPKLTNMAKSMVGFSKNPTILFAMFRRGPQRSIWRRHGADACLCFKTVTKMLNGTVL